MTTPNDLPRCDRCGYALIRSLCPIHDGRQIQGLEPAGVLAPRAMRAFVVPAHFESLRHYYGWRAGIPIRGDRGRWKVPERVRELIMRQFGRRCQWDGGCTTGESPTVEHIRPVAFGGSNHPGNLTLLCPTHQLASWRRWEQLTLPNVVSA